MILWYRLDYIIVHGVLVHRLLRQMCNPMDIRTQLLLPKWRTSRVINHVTWHLPRRIVCWWPRRSSIGKLLAGTPDWWSKFPICRLREVSRETTRDCSGVDVMRSPMMRERWSAGSAIERHSTRKREACEHCNQGSCGAVVASTSLSATSTVGWASRGPLTGECRPLTQSQYSNYYTGTWGSNDNVSGILASIAEAPPLDCSNR